MSEYIGKNWRDFKTACDNYVDLYSLKVGDFFMEDTYPEVHQVTSINGRTVYAHNLTKDMKNEPWYYAADYPAYAPCLVKLEPK